jgi:signal transduction histidine kinase
MLDRLERAAQSQRSFVSDAGHELRTPITIVRGHLELMTDDPADRRETLALVTDELDRMSRLVDDLLLLAKSERKDFLQVQSVDVAALIPTVFAKVAALAPRDWRLDGAAQARVDGDPQRLTQALTQLAQNATQHTDDGDVITLGSSYGGGHVRLWVQDEGEGIAAAEQGRVFERFARAGAGRRRSEGSGLGLSIVAAIADAHDGHVEVDSRPGHGATFTLVLPATASSSPAPAVG